MTNFLSTLYILYRLYKAKPMPMRYLQILLNAQLSFITESLAKTWINTSNVVKSRRADCIQEAFSRKDWAKCYVYPPLFWTLDSLCIGWLVCWSVTLCSSTQEQATDMLYTILEPGQIGYEDPTIKNLNFPSQESGTSLMSPKGHILTWGT